MPKKYIIFTGSFNPVTEAHLHSLQNAMTAIGAEKGFFVPVCDDYLRKKMLNKMERLSLSAKKRMEMLNILCQKHEGLEVSDYEIKKNDSVHTYKTLEYFKNICPDAEIYFLNGADKLKNIPHWNNAEELLQNIRFVLFDRADLCAEELIQNDPLLSRYSDHFTILPATEDFTDVSSSRVRELFLAGDESYRAMMDVDVAAILSEIELGDYPTPGVYDWIGMKLSGGPFDKLYGYKKVYELNRELFAEMDLSDMLSSTKKLGELTAKNSNFGETHIMCSDDDFVSLLYKLKAEGLNPVIISEACFSRVCGGYDQGKADTFEEELCRVSSLSQSLYMFGSPKLKCVKESNVDWRENTYPLNVGDGFYSSNVVFVRHGSGKSYEEIAKADRQKCDIISIAPPDLTKTHSLNHISAYMNDDGCLNSEGKHKLTQVLCKAFDYAIATDHDTVIINAFGSGYHIPLSDIADVFHEVFGLYNGKLKRIIVKSKKSRRYKEFFDRLGEIE